MRLCIILNQIVSFMIRSLMLRVSMRARICLHKNDIEIGLTAINTAERFISVQRSDFYIGSKFELINIIEIININLFILFFSRFYSRSELEKCSTI